MFSLCKCHAQASKHRYWPIGAAHSQLATSFFCLVLTRTLTASQISTSSLWYHAVMHILDTVPLIAVSLYSIYDAMPVIVIFEFITPAVLAAVQSLS